MNRISTTIAALLIALGMTLNFAPAASADIGDPAPTPECGTIGNPCPPPTCPIGAVEITVLSGKIADLQSVVAQRDQQITDLRAVVAQKDQRIGKLRDKVAELRAKIRALQD